MKTGGNTSMSMKTWDEKTTEEIDGERKLTHTLATFAYEGDMEGEGRVEYLMSYHPNGDGNFVGLERFVGRVGARTGSFVIQHTGTFDHGSVHTRWQFLPGSGTGELQGLGGGGEIVLTGHGPYPLAFDYQFD
jgi:hypothetical protein